MPRGKGRKSLTSVKSENEAVNLSEEEDGGQEFDVEAIVNHRWKHGILWYHVKWEGFPSEDNTWESSDSCQNSIKFIDNYWASQTNDVQSQRYHPPTKGTTKKVKSEEEPSVKGKGKRASEVPDSEEVEPAREKQQKTKARTSTAPASAGAESEVSPELEAVAPWSKTIGSTYGAKGKVKTKGKEKEKQAPKSQKQDVDSLLNWEGINLKIDTVERQPDGELRLFIIWVNEDTYSWVPSKIARERCPQRLIDFYESHLRFH